ncbi:sla2 Src-like adaptor 2 [Gonapodya sp. JEL0774]|nr:sla2 Src-like adaptor 2 [Gonapodya sp. JEL0774]
MAMQAEIVPHGRGGSTKTVLYKKNKWWTEGLISAAQALTFATNLLVDAPDGVVKGIRKLEKLVVELPKCLPAATTQLAAASHVKAQQAFGEIRQRRCAKEQAAADVWTNQIRIADMEQQVKILELERDLATAWQKLAERHGVRRTIRTNLPWDDMKDSIVT